MRNLLAEIDRVLPDGGQWCTREKAHALAAMIVALRPQFVVELGVWMGGSMVPMLLAMQYVNTGIGIAIDAWSPAASVVGQDGANHAWWNSVDHDAARTKFLARLEILGLRERCMVVVSKSIDVEPPAVIDLLHVDGNHGPDAIRDVERFGARVSVGGIMILDDLDWSGGAVQHGRELARTMGFEDLYRLGTGVVMQRRADPTVAT